MYSRKRKFLLLTGMALFLSLAIAKDNAISEPLSKRADVQQFIREVSAKYHFNRLYLTRLFSTVHFNRSLVPQVSHPYEAKPWYKYRQTFLSDRRIQGGVLFWNEHQKALAEAEKRYGVPASLIVAILGVESLYGQHMGQYKVLDTLSTLAFAYPPRAKFFRNELVQFLLLTRDLHVDPTTIKGSYAGAIGQAQFMPSSYRSYAVSFRGEPRKDLINNSEDAIISVANYFQQHGWRANSPIVAPAEVQGQKYLNLPVQGAKPTYSLAQLARFGIKAKLLGDTPSAAAFIPLQGASQPEYWLGYHNFHVITRYNSSIHYAMAVYQLAEAIDNARLASIPANESHVA